MGATQDLDGQQYLTFGLGAEAFAVDVIKVREILDFTPPTRVPQTPKFMLGVINLRGSVVPVVDLRQKFGMDVADRTRNTCIIVLELDLDGESIIIGAVADSVQEVLELDPSQIEPPPRIGTKLNVDFIQGMGSRNGGFLIILDIDRVFSMDDLIVLQGTEELAS